MIESRLVESKIFVFIHDGESVMLADTPAAVHP